MKNSNYPLYEVDHISDLKELIENASSKYSSKTAFEYRIKGNKTKKVTYEELKEHIDSLGTAFYSMGLRDSHIAVIGENSYEWIVTYFATVNGSNVIVPIDKDLGVEDIKNTLIDSNCRAVVYSHKYANIMKEIEDGVPKIDYFIHMDGKGHNNKFLSYETLMKKGNELILQGNNDYMENEVDPNKLAAIIYTSGTTGVSKGVMLSHQNLAANTVGTLRHAKVDESSVLILPIHHTFGFTAGVLCMIHSGTKVCINKSLRSVSKDMVNFKPTDLILVPLFLEKMYKKIWDTANKSGKADLLRKTIKISNLLLKIGIDLRRRIFKNILDGFGGNLRLIVCGGAPLDPKYTKGFRDFGINILNGYGITECSPIVSGFRNDYFRDGSIGQVLPCCEVKIDKLTSSDDGEILVKGKTVMLGYYKNEKITRESMDGEWFRTGDIGKIDEDGFLYITGRKKNLIVLRNGKNIYPEELEMLVSNIPYVEEVVVYCEGDSIDKDTNIVAEVYFNKEYIESNEIKDSKKELEKDIDHINSTLAHYKHIKKIRIRENEFEKTTTKKIKRFTINTETSA
ncbi:MAG: AMP-binding protein [Anaeromicrobium sp.]|jgi:long-chain acyl-CoA synthetase|uniref:AMP-dependent synthetase/ligase n=1 Tax=Anaeromicrobium sp. TaxID=1929132 RepID=UPI0025DA68F1|nr:AMP-binding protein [Anaeromicrobium sp.]MCT4592797.1 AMP-binding protein [Anaeromicrobium sp.]